MSLRASLPALTPVVTTLMISLTLPAHFTNDDNQFYSIIIIIALRHGWERYPHVKSLLNAHAWQSTPKLQRDHPTLNLP